MNVSIYFNFVYDTDLLYVIIFVSQVMVQFYSMEGSLGIHLIKIISGMIPSYTQYLT